MFVPEAQAGNYTKEYMEHTQINTQVESLQMLKMDLLRFSPVVEIEESFGRLHT